MKIGKIMILVAALTMAWGCSSDDEEKLEGSTFIASEKPKWLANVIGNDDKPQWEAPDPLKYESSMFIMVKLEQRLVGVSTDNDMMTVLINGECRAVPAVRQIDNFNSYYFVLKVRGNSKDRDVSFSLCYYCAMLHQLFILTGKESFAAERTYGVEEDYIPPLFKGNTKFPIQFKQLIHLPENAPFNQSKDDRVAVFVGDECRGQGEPDSPFYVFCTNENETLQVRYYSAEKGGIYTLKQTMVPTKDEERESTIAF